MPNYNEECKRNNFKKYVRLYGNGEHFLNVNRTFFSQKRLYEIGHTEIKNNLFGNKARCALYPKIRYGSIRK